MAEKVIKTRLQLKHDTIANWNSATNFIPKSGEPIIYTDGLSTTPLIKIGDGKTKVSALPFTGASRVANNLTVKLNNGSTENTNLFTYNGSAGKTINITPSAIGAAAASHSHSNYASTNHEHKYITPTNKIWYRGTTGWYEVCHWTKDILVLNLNLLVQSSNNSYISCGYGILHILLNAADNIGKCEWLVKAGSTTYTDLIFSVVTDGTGCYYLFYKLTDALTTLTITELSAVNGSGTHVNLTYPDSIPVATDDTTFYQKYTSYCTNPSMIGYVRRADIADQIDRPLCIRDVNNVPIATFNGSSVVDLTLTPALVGACSSSDSRLTNKRLASNIKMTYSNGTLTIKYSDTGAVS